MGRTDAIGESMAKARALGSVEIPSLEGKVGAEEWKVRVDLAAAYRLVAHFGWDDLIFTHLSARVPGPEHHFLLNPYNLMFEEVTRSEEHTSELQSLMRISYAVFCLKKKKKNTTNKIPTKQ